MPNHLIFYISQSSPRCDLFMKRKTDPETKESWLETITGNIIILDWRIV